VRAIPTGAVLDVRALVSDLLHDIATTDGLLDDLCAYAEAVETGTRPDPHRPEPLRLEHLLDRLDTRVHLYGGEVAAVAGRLADIARPKPLPVQQDRRSA
jgi:hypothetical protein